MKKSLFTVLASTVLLGSVVGAVSCTGPESKETVITFYSTMGKNLVTTFDSFLEEFYKENPGIKVEHTQVGGYDDVRDQISKELAVGNGPDLAYCYADHVALYNTSKSVLALDDFINSKDPAIGLSDAQLDDFVDGYYEEGRQFGDGKMYTLPFSKSTEVLYYNETFFTANNIKVPTHWFSADQNDDTSVEAVCAQIKAIDPSSIPLGYDSEANWFITMCEQLELPYTSATGEKFQFKTDGAKDFLKKLKGLFDKGYFTTQKKYGSYTSGLFVQTSEKEQKSYMSIGSSAGATHQRPKKDNDKYPFNVGIAPIPQANAAHKKAISQGPSICLFDHNDAKRAEAAWKLLKYFTTSVAFQAQFSVDSGYIPVLKSVQENDAYKKHIAKADGGDGISALSAKVCMEQADTYFTSPAFVGSSEARDQVGNVMLGVLDLNATDANYETDINKLFDDAIVKCKNAAE